METQDRDPILLYSTNPCTQQLLSTYCVPDTFLDTWDPVVNKTDNPRPHGVYILVRETDTK